MKKTPREKALLLEPSLAGLEIGSPEWFATQLHIIESRRLIRETYRRWYGLMLGDVATVPSAALGSILEVGSGSGYVKKIEPAVITSDIVPGNVDLVIDGRNLPFEDASLRGILLTHVFHHIPDIRQFLREADRTLVDEGVVTMIDVAHTPLSRLLFGRFHPEDYDSSVADWTLDENRPCGGANQALSWIVLVRDRARFEREFPHLRIECVELLPWLGYLVSGGVTRRNVIPDVLAKGILATERATAFANGIFGLHWHIRIRRISR